MDIFEPIFLELLEKYKVEYILIGGMAVNIHGYSRPTGDMDIWMNPTNDNGQKIILAIDDFGYNVSVLKEKNFEVTDVIFLGQPPFRIDILNKIHGLNFYDCYQRIAQYTTENNLSIPVLHLNDLIVNKLLSARHKDLDDIENLKKEID